MQESNTLTEQEIEVAQLIVTTLNLDMAPSAIDPTAALYEEGLGLDSIDILEVALAVSKAFGVKLQADDTNNVTIFRSLRSLNDYIRQHQAR